MRRHFRSLAIAITLALCATSTPAYAEVDDYLANITLDKDTWLVLAAEQSRDGVHSQLSLQPGSVGVGEKRGQWMQCASAEDPTCSSAVALKTIIGSSVLPYCEATESEVCVESLKIGRVGEDLPSATYMAEYAGRQDFPGSEKKNLLDGRGVPVFESASVSNEAGNRQFAVMVRATQFWSTKSKKFEPFSVEAEVLPYFIGPKGEGAGACLFQIEQSCAKPADFLPGTRLEIAFRVPNSVGGWFSGRMKDPTISVRAINSDVNLITIASEPVEVAALGLVKKKADFTGPENMWVENNGKWQTNGGIATGANGWQPNIFPFIENYRSQAKDTSIGTNLVWKMRTISSGSGSGCLADKSKVLGIVTTNALGYDGSSPAFKNGFLEYKVAGLHYMPNGTDLVIGTYDLVMRSETARCLYKFSKAPLSATVSVTGGAEKNVATTIVSEKNGWLKMAAYGFTFSKKTIKVKISKKKK
ncbi:MAG: hypothetical protein RIQ37_876 [Actinomycetota bacterium]